MPGPGIKDIVTMIVYYTTMKQQHGIFRSIWFGTLTTLALCIFNAGHAWADAGPIKNIPELGAKSNIPMENFTRGTILHKIEAQDELLAHRVRLPKKWKKVEAESRSKGAFLGTNVPDSIVRFVSPPRMDQRSEFRVRAVRLDHQITSRQWFTNYAIKNALTLAGMRKISRDRVEVSYASMINGQSYMIRAAAVINGQRMIIGEFITPDSYYSREKDVMVRVIDSFQLLNKVDQPSVATKTYGFVDIAEFQYPSNWTLKAPPVRSLNRMKAAVINVPESRLQTQRNFETEFLHGRIDIKLVSKAIASNIQAEVILMRDQLENLGFDVGSLIESVENVEFDKSIKQAKVQVYDVSDEQERFHDYELWVAVMNTENYYVTVSLLTPARDVDFYPWAINTEAFKYLISTLRMRR